jgi:hypothetical protein
MEWNETEYVISDGLNNFLNYMKQNQAYLKGSWKTLSRAEPLPVNLSSNKHKDGRGVSQCSFPDSKAYCCTKTKSAEDLAVECSYNH